MLKMVIHYLKTFTIQRCCYDYYMGCSFRENTLKDKFSKLVLFYSLNIENRLWISV